MGVYEKLSKVQKVLKAPKNQVNSYANYKYRSCEDILEAAKPLCVDHGLVLMISDDIKVIGERVYVMATAGVTDIETAENVEVHAFAREPLQKKGSDESQITGAASSYARKYALNGLFCIDDTKDADATNDHGKGKTDEQKNEEMKASVNPLLLPGGDINAKRELFAREIVRTHISQKAILDAYSVKSVEEMDDIKITSALGKLSEKPTYNGKK